MRRARCAAWLLVGVAMTSCSDEPAASVSIVEWTVTFGADVPVQSVTAVIAEIRTGGCRGGAIWSERVPRDRAATMQPPPVEPGRYGFAAMAVDTRCTRVAEACVDRELTRTGARTSVTLTVERTDATRLCATYACDAGACTDAAAPTHDAGPDLGIAPFDAGPDAFGPPDRIEPDRPGCTTRETPIVAAGGEHTCAVDAMGHAWCWGADDEGRLGAGEPLGEARIPVEVATSVRFIAMSAGGAHTCAIDGDRRLRCWGDNAHGQLGTGDTAARAEPTLVAMPVEVLDVAAGLEHTCARDLDGAVWCWGADDRGQLGDALAGADRSLPRILATVPAGGALTAGDRHTCTGGAFAAPDIQSVCWGEPGPWLGRGAGSGDPSPAPPSGSDVFVAASITAGARHTCAVGFFTPDFAPGARCWGEGTHGQLGTGNTASSAFPIDVVLATDFASSLVAGGAATCGSTFGFNLYCVGDNSHGVIGPDAGTGDVLSPVTILTRATLGDVGRDHVCANAAEIGLVCWGSNTRGQLGTGAVASRDPTPRRVCF